MVGDLEPRRRRGCQVYICAVVGDELWGTERVPAWVQCLSEGEVRWRWGDTGEWLLYASVAERLIDEMNIKLDGDAILGDALDEIETELGM